MGAGYVYALSSVQLVTGFLAVGLASRWGVELFGRRLNRYAVLAGAGLGTLGATLIFTVSLTMEILSGARPDKGLVTGRAADLMFVCYTPILLWVRWWRSRRSITPAGRGLSKPDTVPARQLLA